MKKNKQVALNLIEGEDYYFEQDLMVFTANYLQKRGYCCKNLCKHCPWGFVPNYIKSKAQK